jgi:hypothetical protein
MEAGVGVPLPPVPDYKSTEYEAKDIDPQLDNLISQRAAQVVQQAPQMKQIAAITAQQQGQQQNPLQYAQQLAQLETEALKARTQAQISADQAKAQSSIQIKQAEAQQDMQIEAAKAQADLQAKITKLEAELQLEREKNASKIQMEREKNAADIQMEALKGE